MSEAILAWKGSQDADSKGTDPWGSVAEKLRKESRLPRNQHTRFGEKDGDYPSAVLIEKKWERSRTTAPPVRTDLAEPTAAFVYPRSLVRMFTAGLFLLVLGLSALLIGRVAPAFESGLLSSFLVASGCLLVTAAIFKGQTLRGIA